MATNLARIGVYLLDAGGFVANVPLYLTVDTAQTVAQMITEAQSVLSLLDVLTGSQISSTTFSLVVSNPGGVKGSPVANSKNVEQGVIGYTNTLNAYPFDSAIPAILASKISGNKLNLLDPDVAAYAGHLDANAGAYRYIQDGGGNLNGIAHSFRRIRKRSPASTRRTGTLGP